MKAVSAQVVCYCVYDKSKQNKEDLHGTIPYMLDYWADPVVHLLLLEISMAYFLLACGAKIKDQRFSILDTYLL